MSIRQQSLPRLLKRALSESLSRYSDRQLLDRFTDSGDETAFTAILDRHGPTLLDLCQRWVGDAHVADDVLQATFLVLARKAGSIRRRDSLASWLYGVAQRLARQARLTEAARSRRERRAAKEHREVSVRDPGWDELLRVLDQELQRLPERYRSPLILCYLEGGTQDEAAKQLGWSLSTLRRRLDSGRELLRGRMTRRGATLGAGLFAGLLAPSAARATLTVELRRIILAAVTTGGKGVAVSASVLVLANGGMRMATIAKISLWSALAVAMGGVLAGVVWQIGPAVEAGQPAAQARPAQVPEQGVEAHLVELAEEPAERRDRFNDHLPNGAIARLGTMAFRHGRISDGATLTFTPDDKHLVSTGGGWIRSWNLATGFASVNLGDGWRGGTAGTDLATADGKLGRICLDVLLPTRGVEWRCTEYELESGKELRSYRLDFPPDDVHRSPYILSPDGKTYAELNHAGKLTLWNAVDGTVTLYLKPQAGAYTAVAFPPDGRTVVVGDDGHSFRVFDLATGKEQRSFGFLNTNVVARMAISPDGKWLVTVGGQKGNNPPVWPHDRFLRLWNLEEGTVARTLDFPEDWGVQSLVFTRDSRTLIAGVSGGKSGSPAAVRSWDVVSGKPGRAWTDDPAIGLTLAVSHDGKTLGTLNRNGVIRLWDMQTGKETNPIEASPCSLEAVCFRPDGKTVVTIGDDRAIREWEAATGRQLGPPRGRVKGSWPEFSAGGKLLVTSSAWGDDQSIVRLQDAATGKLLLELPGVFPVTSVDGQRMANCDDDKRIRVFQIDTGKLIQTFTPPEEEISGWLYPFARGFTPDGQSLIVQGETMSVWDLRRGERKTSWSLRDNKVLEQSSKPGPNSWERIESVAVSPDVSKVAFALRKPPPRNGGPRHWFSRMMMFEMSTGKLLHQADVEDDSLEQIAFSPDGKLLAAGGGWTVRVWDVQKGQAVRQFEGHRGRVKSLAFSPDSTRLASASEDSTVLVWDVSR